MKTLSHGDPLAGLRLYDGPVGALSTGPDARPRLFVTPNLDHWRAAPPQPRLARGLPRRRGGGERQPVPATGALARGPADRARSRPRPALARGRADGVERLDRRLPPRRGGARAGHAARPADLGRRAQRGLCVQALRAPRPGEARRGAAGGAHLRLHRRSAERGGRARPAARAAPPVRHPVLRGGPAVRRRPEVSPRRAPCRLWVSSGRGAWRASRTPAPATSSTPCSWRAGPAACVAWRRSPARRRPRSSRAPSRWRGCPPCRAGRSAPPQARAPAGAAVDG